MSEPAPHPTVRRYVNAFQEDEDSVMLLYRHGERVLGQRVAARYVSYLLREQVTPQVERMLRGQRAVRSMRPEGRWWRVEWAGRRVRQMMSEDAESPLVQAGVRSYEADVTPIQRWFADEAPAVAPPRRCYLDIEADSHVPFAEKEQSRVYVVTVRDDAGNRFRQTLEEDTDAAERRLLDWMWGVLRSYDQVFAWGSPFGETYDWTVIWARSRVRGCAVDARRWLWVDYCQLFKRMNMHSAESGEEKQSLKLDDIALQVVGKGKEVVPDWVRERFGAKSLGALSHELYAEGGRFRELLTDYCAVDTDRLAEIEEETGYAALFQTLCDACGLFADTAALNPTRQVDGFMLRLGRSRGDHFPTRTYGEPEEQFKGAYVMSPRTLSAAWRKQNGHETGIARDVHVVDFKSLYPSIILTLNMSPDTKVPGMPVNGPIPEGCCRTPTTGVGFRTGEDGVLVVALREMMRLRKEWSERKASLPPGTEEYHHADRMSTAYKVAANSFYGVVGSPYSRYFDRAIAEGVTQTGVWLIKQTIAAAEERGWQAIYTDTDSVFVVGATLAEFDAFVAWCNKELYPRLLKAQGCTENAIKLAYEKQFDRVVFTSAKRYCGRFVHYDGTRACSCTKRNKRGEEQPGAVDVRKLACRDCGATYPSIDALPPLRGRPEIKGLEYKRGDALRLARELQAEVIDMLVGGMGVARCPSPTEDLEHYHAALSRARERVLEGPLAVADIKQSQSLKHLREYAQKPKKDGTLTALPLHVQVAKVLAERGQEVRAGTRVEYVVVDGASAPMRAIPADDYTGEEADRYYLWESKVYPPTQRLLEAAFPNHDWEGWARARPQKPRGNAARLLPGQLPLLGGAVLDRRRAERVELGIRAGTGEAKPGLCARSPVIEARAVAEYVARRASPAA